LKFLLILIVLAVLIIAPVMYMARALGANKTSLGSVVFAIFLASLVNGALEHVHLPGLVEFIVSFIAATLIYQWVLATTFKKAAIIGIVSTAITVLGVLILMKLLGL
jgi:hypothetical protein